MNIKKSILSSFVAAGLASSVSAAGSLSFETLQASGVQAPVPQVELKVPEPSRQAAPGDVTAQLYSVFKAGAELTPAEVAKLKQLYVVFVPGFLTDPSVNPDQLLPDKGLVKLPTYFDEQVTFLRSLGVECGIAKIESEASVHQNALALRRLIKAAHKKVLIIGHSKGGLDSLDALLTDPGARAKVAGVITLQSPFLGSPIADMVLSHPTLSYSSAKLLGMMGGSKESMVDLSVASRLDYAVRNRAAIAALTAKVPYLCIATYIDDKIFTFDTLLEPFRDYMIRKGLRNDGLVPTQNAILPGSRHAVLGGLDHLATVLKVPRPAFDRVRFLKAALKLQLR